MTPDELRSALDGLGITQREAARLLQVSDSRVVRRWLAGERSFPGPAVVLMRVILNVPEAREFLGLSLKDETPEA